MIFKMLIILFYLQKTLLDVQRQKIHKKHTKTWQSLPSSLTFICWTKMTSGWDYCPMSSTQLCRFHLSSYQTQSYYAFCNCCEEIWVRMIKYIFLILCIKTPCLKTKKNSVFILNAKYIAPCNYVSSVGVENWWLSLN